MTGKIDIKLIHHCDNEKDGLRDCLVRAIDKKTNKEIGFIYYHYETLKKSIFITQIAVEENFRRKGIATKMMKKLERNTDAKIIDFELSEDGEAFFNKYYKEDL